MGGWACSLILARFSVKFFPRVLAKVLPTFLERRLLRVLVTLSTRVLARRLLRVLAGLLARLNETWWNVSTGGWVGI